jgi:hypothetical protein
MKVRLHITLFIIIFACSCKYSSVNKENHNQTAVGTWDDNIVFISDSCMNENSTRDSVVLILCLDWEMENSESCAENFYIFSNKSLVKDTIGDLVFYKVSLMDLDTTVEFSISGKLGKVSLKPDFSSVMICPLGDHLYVRYMNCPLVLE